MVIAQKGRSPDSDSGEIRRKRCAQILEQVFGPPNCYNEITVLDTLRSKALAEAQVNLAVCARDVDMILEFVRKKDKELELKKGKEEREELGAVVLHSPSARLGNEQSTAIIKKTGEDYTIFRKNSCTDKSGFDFHDKSKIVEQNTVIVKPETTNEGLILKATTSSKEPEEEMLTQKLEDIREVPVVEAEPKFDIQNPPKTKGPPTLNATVIDELSRANNFDAKDEMDELAMKYLQELTEIQRQIIKDMELLGIPCDKSATKYKGILFKTVLERNLGAPYVDIGLQKKTIANSESEVFMDNKPVPMGAAKAPVESAFAENRKTMSFDLKDWKYCNDSFRHHYTEYSKRFGIDKDEVSQSPSCRILQQDNLHSYNCQSTGIGLERVLEESAVLSQSIDFLRGQAFAECQTSIQIEPLRSVQIFIDESLSRLNLNNETAAESLRRMREQDRIIYCREIGRQLAKNLAVLNFCPPKSSSGKLTKRKCRPKCPPARTPCPSPVKPKCITDPPRPPKKKKPPPCPCPPPKCSCPPLPEPKPVVVKCPPPVMPCPPAGCLSDPKPSGTRNSPQVKPRPPKPDKSPLGEHTCTPIKEDSGPSPPPRKSPLSSKCERPATPKTKCPKCPPHPQRTDEPGVPECEPPEPKCNPPSSVCPPCPTPKPECAPTATKPPARKASAKPWKRPKCPFKKPCGGPPFCSCVGYPRGIVLKWTPSEELTKKSLLPVLPNNYCIATESSANSETPLVALHYIFAFRFQDMYVVRVMGPKDYTPWTPIPSWPYPIKQKKCRLQCPKEGCPIPLPPRVRPRCLQFPCPGFPKRLSKFTKIE